MKELGLKVNLHESTVSRYEKGTIKALDIDKLKEFAIALDVPPEYITGWDVNNVTNTQKNFFNEIQNLSLTEDELSELIEYAKFIKNRRR